MSNHNRAFSPYELTHLRRHGIDPENISAKVTTPVEYLTGHVTFCEQDFLVTQDTLIPRIETEGLVERATVLAQQLVEKKASETVVMADIGTGCGAIAICVSKNLQQLGVKHQFFAADVSQAAVLVAEKNVQRLLGQLDPTRVRLFHSDLLTSFPKITLDLLLANLPYIPTERISSLEKSVKNHEPHLALNGGDDGLELIREFLNQALEFTHTGSQVLLEVDYTHTAAVFAVHAAEWQISTQIDEFLRQRFVILTRK